MGFLYKRDMFGDPFIIVAFGFVASVINCFCVKYEETPCNATI